MKYFEVQTGKKLEVVDITSEVEGLLQGSGARAVLVYVPHATAALVINEFEPGLKSDMEKFFSSLVPDRRWKHDEIDNNASSHLLSALLSPSTVVPLENGKLALGTWQRIILVELDGPRNRKITVTPLR